MSSEKLKIVLGYILICILWGSTWLAIRVGLDSLTPIFSAGLRFLLASLFIFILMKLKNILLQKDSISIRIYLILGLFSFVFPFGLVYWAEQFIPSGLASVIFAVMPFFVILFSALTMKDEVITPGQIIGVSFGFFGITTIFSEGLFLDISSNLWGIVAVLVSSLIQAGIAVMMKKYGKHINPLSVNFIPLLIAGIIMIPAGLIAEDSAKLTCDYKAIFSILYLAFFGTVITFTTYYWLMKRINVVILSLSTFITPIVAVLLGWIFLSESFSSQTLLGSGLVLVGILFANFSGLKNYFRPNPLVKK